jgi:hypothetical protein
MASYLSLRSPQGRFRFDSYSLVCQIRCRLGIKDGFGTDKLKSWAKYNAALVSINICSILLNKIKLAFPGAILALLGVSLHYREQHMQVCC